jgi:hypothetical protein
MLTRRLLLAACAMLVVALGAPAAASATAIPEVRGSTLFFDGDPAGGGDGIAVFETANAIRITRFGDEQLGEDGSTCFFVGDQNTVDCTKQGVTLIVLNLGAGNDVASVSPSVKIPVHFDGGIGNDALFGGGGRDQFVGGIGDDNIVSRDALAEDVDCGQGNDTAISDDGDRRVSCEEIEGDADADGVRRPADCDDTNPLLRPGAADIADNGVDEDCNGVDATNLDRDGDGSPRPQDCDDTNPAIRPGAREVIGNAVDENCDSEIEPFPPLTGSVSGTWTRAGTRTRNLTLTAKGFPKGTRITLRCVRSRHCSKKVKRRTVRSSRRRVNLHALLGNRALAAGARLELRFTRADRIGRLLRYRIGKPGLPGVSFLCAPPGRRAGPC